MSARWSERFSSDGSDVLLETDIGTAVNRMRSIIDEYIDADMATLQRLQEREFAMNPTYKTGWETAKAEFDIMRKDKSLTAIQQTQYPDEYHIALICYSLDEPKVYKEFNMQTKNVKEPKDLLNYYYKSFFIFLLRSIDEMYGAPANYPDSLYRGTRLRFANAEPGKYIIFQHVTSTSAKEDIAKDFVSSGGTLFEIRGYIQHSTGMAHHSVFDEEEFVIWPFEYFKILQVTPEDGYTRITLQA